MPTKDSFDAVIYLAIMHGDTTMADLKLGHQNLHFEATERTGQLKSLVGLPQVRLQHLPKLLCYVLFLFGLPLALMQHIMAYTNMQTIKMAASERV